MSNLERHFEIPLDGHWAWIADELSDRAIHGHAIFFNDLVVHKGERLEARYMALGDATTLDHRPHAERSTELAVHSARAWLRVAMRFDLPSSRDAWKERFRL